MAANAHMEEKSNDGDESVDASIESGVVSSERNGQEGVKCDDNKIASTKSMKHSVEKDNDRMLGNAAESTSSCTDDHVAVDEETTDGASTSSLVKSSLPSNKSFDDQVNAMVTSNNGESYIYFDQWKRKLNGKSTVTRLRLAFEQLLPRLLGARDYAGAAKVLGVMYHRFALTRNVCIEASLEILRRRPDYRNAVLSFYEAVLEVHNQRIEKMSILKEMWLFHIVHGEFYEAYHMYQDKIEQMEEAEEDARLLANFGILCYWLMLIESRELRDRFKRDEMDDMGEDDDDADATVRNAFGESESIESVIESHYLFKTPIGVHILYQHANNALRRAVALSPTSAMFVEHYVQLLVLVQDIQPACDYLEAFFHTNPDDPHGPRMVRLLARFLGRYYPDSVDAQVIALSRWMKNDPSCAYPLEKLLELSSAGAVSSFMLTKVLVEALDTCGSDLYVKQNPDIALTLWRNLAELLVAMDEDEFLMDQVERGVTETLNQETLADVGMQRAWWKRVYLSRPNTMEEVVAAAKCDSVFVEVSIYRAAVSDRLFPGQLSMTEALRSAIALPNVAIRHEHVRLFKSFFPSASNTATKKVARMSFSEMSFMLITDDWKRKELPVFKGSSHTVHVLDRECIVEREAATEQAKVMVTRTGNATEVDQEFVEELYQALESEVGLSSMKDRRSQGKRKADAISVSAAQTLIPGFVRMVEEEVYNNPKATVQHIYSMIHQKLRRSDMLVPTSKVVAHCVDFFRDRFKKNVEIYGHGGLMMQYDDLIATYVRRQRAKGVFEVTKDTARAAIEAMKRVLPSSHPHFPDRSLVEETMRIKAAMFVRLRRLRLMALKQMLKPILKTIVYVDEKAFVDAVYTVCIHNGLFGVVTHTDIARTLQNLLPLHYYRVLQRMPPRLTRLLTSPEFRKDCNTLEEILSKLKSGNSQRRTKEVKALLWVERYEALYGPILDDEDDSVEESDSDTSSSSSSSSDSSTTSDCSSGSDSSIGLDNQGARGGLDEEEEGRGCSDSSSDSDEDM